MVLKADTTRHTKNHLKIHYKQESHIHKVCENETTFYFRFSCSQCSRNNNWSSWSIRIRPCVFGGRRQCSRLQCFEGKDLSLWRAQVRTGHPKWCFLIDAFLPPVGGHGLCRFDIHGKCLYVRASRKKNSVKSFTLSFHFLFFSTVPPHTAVMN